MKDLPPPPINPVEADNFEAAFSRLEAILECMNSATISLDDSLKLFEEADKLIQFCNERLEKAGKRVEMLMKTRTGEILLDTEGRPVAGDFLPPVGSRSA